jgi:hypothetical protein
VTRIAGLLLSAIAVHLAADVIRALIKQGGLSERTPHCPGASSGGAEPGERASRKG